MTRKHFKSFADALRAARPLRRGALQQWMRDVRAVAEVCSRYNPRFSSARFLEASGYYDDESPQWNEEETYSVNPPRWNGMEQEEGLEGAR